MLIYVNHVCAYIHTQPLSIYIFYHVYSKDWGWKDNCPLQFSFSSRASHIIKIMSRFLLSISKDGDSTSLGNLCPSSVILPREKPFLIFIQNLLCLSWCPLPLVLALGATEKSLALSLHPPSRFLHAVRRSPQSSLFSRLQPQLSQPFLTRGFSNR